MELDLRNRVARLLTAGGAAEGTWSVPWQVLGFEALPTHASTRAEMRVDLGPLGAAAGDDDADLRWTARMRLTGR